MTKRNSLSLRMAGLLFVCLFGVALWGITTTRNDAVAPVPLDQLGLSLDHSAKAELVAAQMPQFLIVGAEDQDNTRKNVRLWTAALAVNEGHWLPCGPQEIGDCVSWAAARAVNALACQQIFNGQNQELHLAFPPFIYGASRVTVGAKHGSHFRGDGSVGAYAAEAVQTIGVLPSDHPDCPPYSGAVAKDWGARGPPAWAIAAARGRMVQTVSRVKTAADVRDAICNLYPVTTASDFGTKTIRPQDGRQVAKHDASWQHAMCVTAYNGSGAQPYFYLMNSWGSKAHPEPLQGEPPGGFWIDSKTMDYIAQQGDCWAYSAFDGFPAQLDVSPLRPRPPPNHKEP